MLIKACSCCMWVCRCLFEFWRTIKAKGAEGIEILVQQVPTRQLQKLVEWTFGGADLEKEAQVRLWDTRGRSARMHLQAKLIEDIFVSCRSHGEAQETHLCVKRCLWAWLSVSSTPGLSSGVQCRFLVREPHRWGRRVFLKHRGAVLML